MTAHPARRAGRSWTIVGRGGTDAGTGISGGSGEAAA